MIVYFLIAFVAACVCAVLIVRFEHLHPMSADSDLTGPQKIHTHPVPRVGGLAIMLGLIVCVFIQTWGNWSSPMWLVILASLPAWGFGMLEDLCKRVGVWTRLLATFASSLLGYWLLGAYMPRLDVPGLDVIYTSTIVIPVVFTMVTVGGIAHAINIIDGFNGLAGMVSLLFLCAFGYVAFQLNDVFVLTICVSLAGAILGFLVWNFPVAHLFSGDGGAYLIGFLIAEIAVLLCVRHSEVSPWFPLLVVIYPVFEVFYSVYRRKFVRGLSAGLPDALHFHQLIYKRLVRWMVGSKEAKHRAQRNSMTSPYLWGVALLSVAPAMIFWDNPGVLAGFVLIFCIGYVWLYSRIVSFRSPRFLVIRKIYPGPIRPLPKRPVK